MTVFGELVAIIKIGEVFGRVVTSNKVAVAS